MYYKFLFYLICTHTLRDSPNDLPFQNLMPGGVNSPVRAFNSVGGNPIVFDRVKGPYAWDLDDNKYIDFIGSWGTAIAGHANDEVLEAITQTMRKGTSFGAPGLLENVLSQSVIDAVSSVDMIRFTNSGTEACMGVLRLARAFTGRDDIIKFDGCYHGHADSFLVQAGSGVATLGLPNSPGVLKEATKHTLIADYNNLEQVEDLLKNHKCAAVILEPVVGNSGFIPPAPGFLEGLRDLTKRYGALLIFDEVMTGFRISYGGAQSHFNITPDLTTFGKIIGGGLPVGAFGGRKDIMSLIAPSGPVYQAGTLSGNPMAMAGGLTTLKILQRESTYEHLNKVTHTLVQGILEAAKKHGHAMTGASISGMFGFFFNDRPVNNFKDAAQSDLAKFAKFHRMMLERGVYFAPSQFEAGFTSIKHSMEDIQQTIQLADEVLGLLEK